MDPVFLKKIPPEEFSNGMAEVIKHGVLEASLFTWLERNTTAIHKRDVKTLETMIVKNVRIKKAIVEADEKESDIRMLLNLGHTFGHALEHLSKYEIPHGQAVSIGLVYAASFAKMPEIDRLIDLLQAFNLPTHLDTPYPAAAMVKSMQADKKNQGRNITLILPKAIGSIHIHRNTTPKTIVRFLQQYHAQDR
jgi:3-dehydroquinate synthetase